MLALRIILEEDALCLGEGPRRAGTGPFPVTSGAQCPRIGVSMFLNT
jgi:hypothetical protein